MKKIVLLFSLIIFLPTMSRAAIADEPNLPKTGGRPPAEIKFLSADYLKLINLPTLPRSTSKLQNYIDSVCREVGQVDVGSRRAVQSLRLANTDVKALEKITAALLQNTGNGGWAAQCDALLAKDLSVPAYQKALRDFVNKQRQWRATIKLKLTLAQEVAAARVWETAFKDLLLDFDKTTTPTLKKMSDEKTVGLLTQFNLWRTRAAEQQRALTAAANAGADILVGEKYQKQDWQKAAWNLHALRVKLPTTYKQLWRLSAALADRAEQFVPGRENPFTE